MFSKCCVQIQLSTYTRGTYPKLLRTTTKVKDGFLTAGEPLFVVQTRDPSTYNRFVCMWDGALGTFSLGYMKGYARATSMLALVPGAGYIDSAQFPPTFSLSLSLSLYTYNLRRSSE